MKPVFAIVCCIVFLLTSCSNKKRSAEVVCSPATPILDTRDNHIYKTVKIGSQVWMAENLAFLPAVSKFETGSDQSRNYYVEGYEGVDVIAAKATANYSAFGVLYNWSAAGSACPNGWHLPSDQEWATLDTYLSKHGYVEDGLGFNVLHVGLRINTGDSGIGDKVWFWSASVNRSYALARFVSPYRATGFRYPFSKSYGFSVRCVKDQ